MAKQHAVYICSSVTCRSDEAQSLAIPTGLLPLPREGEPHRGRHTPGNLMHRRVSMLDRKLRNVEQPQSMYTQSKTRKLGWINRVHTRRLPCVLSRFSRLWLYIPLALPSDTCLANGILTCLWPSNSPPLHNTRYRLSRECTVQSLLKPSPALLKQISPLAVSPWLRQPSYRPPEI